MSTTKELRNREILRAYEAIFPLAQQDELPITLKARIRRVWRVLRPEGQTLYEFRDELWQKHGERDSDGELVKREMGGGVLKQVFKSKNDEETVDREWDALMDLTHSLTFEPIPWQELEDADRQLQRRGQSLAISARQLDELEEAGFVSEEPSEDKEAAGQAQEAG